MHLCPFHFTSRRFSLSGFLSLNYDCECIFQIKIKSSLRASKHYIKLISATCVTYCNFPLIRVHKCLCPPVHISVFTHFTTSYFTSLHINIMHMFVSLLFLSSKLLITRLLVWRTFLLTIFCAIPVSLFHSFLYGNQLADRWNLLVCNPSHRTSSLHYFIIDVILSTDWFDKSALRYLRLRE